MYTVTLTATEGAQTDTISADIVVTSPLAITPTPNPLIPVIVQPILVPVRSPHYTRTPHDAQPPTHRQPTHKDQSPVNKQPVQKSPDKPADKPKHR